MSLKKTSQITTDAFTPPHVLKTAVLFLTFNRTDTTKQVFEAIRKAKPPRLYVAADGPRADKAGEQEKCEEVHQIATQVDWDCEVQTLFRDKNLGCRVGVSTAIDWFFENEEEGIILEDDCLPSQSFFWFCEELLERYQDDMRVMAVSGDNFQKGPARNEFSYYFSKFNHCWGWASWRRAWLYYEKDMQSWPYIRDNGYLQDILSDKAAVKYWSKTFKAAYRNEIDSWAYRWTFSCWIQNGLTVLPNVNLVTNIGFGGYATHTTGKDNANSKMPAFELSFPLNHPNWMIRDKRADDYTQKTNFNQPNIFYQVIRKFYRLIF